MATEILKDQKVWFDGYDLTTRLQSIQINRAVETPDDTTLGDNTRSMKAGGLETGVIQVEGLYDPGALDKAIYDALGLSGKVLTVGTSGTEGAVVYTMQAMLGDYEPIKGATGDLIGFSAGAVTQKSPLLRATLFENESALSSSGNGTGRQLGVVAAGQTIYAGLHVLTATGSSPTLDVVIQSDDNAGFISATNRITFTQFAAIGSEWKSLAGAITDDYWRVTWTITGSTPVFGIVAVLGIK